MSRYQPRHARPKKRRGNQWTPLIHILACGFAWWPSVVTVRHFTVEGGFLSHANPTAVVFIGGSLSFIVWEVFIAAVISAVCVIVEMRYKNRHTRILKRL